MENLPPHDANIEAAALGCVLLTAASQQEVDALLLQLRPGHFYDLRHKTLHAELVRMRMEGHAVDAITLSSWIKGREESIGGLTYARGLPDLVPSVQNFSEYLKQLTGLHRRRWALAESARLAERATNGDIDLADLREELSEALDTLDKATIRERPLIEIVTVAEAKAYVPEPRTFLVGEDIISLGELTVIGGLPGLGKSRLSTTLAFAGAAGCGHWMGYPIRRKWRTLVLQSENSMRRIQSEVKDVPDEYGEWVRFSKPINLAFNNADFRRELRRYWESWPFDMLQIDPWSDVIRDDKFCDHQEALLSIQSSLPDGDSRPALLIDAHLKKTVVGEKRMTGYLLLSQLSGSFRIGQKARTAFFIQPASEEAEDDRIIFDCGKSNNFKPMPMSAWHRCNGAFLPCASFDFDEWLSPSDESRKPITLEAITELLKNGRRAAKKILVEELKQKGFTQPTAYRALDVKGKFGEHLEEVDGLINWKG
jgi:hypothetical protein